MMTTTSPRIAFDDVGDGRDAPALLFMPGWCGPRTVFRPLYEPLASTHRVLALDWRGHGGSDRVASDFGLAELVADALAVIEASRARRIVPIGVAHAGWVAIELRRRLGPEMVPGLVLVEWMPLGAPAPFTAALAALQDEHAWSGTREKLFAKWTAGVSEPAVHAYVASMGELGFDMWSRGGREIAAAFAANESPARALEALTPACPTLHLLARPSDASQLEAQQRYASSHPWFSVRALDASSHFPVLEVPREAAQAIRTFAEQCIGRAS